MDSKGVLSGVDWLENKLMEFNRILGMPIKCFEKEILALVKITEARKGNRAQLLGVIESWTFVENEQRAKEVVMFS